MNRSISIILVILMCAALIGSVALCGFAPLGITGMLEDDGVRKGLDLVGGSYIVYEADVDESMSAEDIDKNMDVVVTMLTSRLDALGYTEGTVSKYGDKRVKVEIPQITDPEEAVQKLGSTAELTFVDSNGDVVISGTDVADAQAAFGDPTGRGVDEYFVSLTLTSEGATKFAEGTDRASKMANGSNWIEIQLDGKQQSRATVSSRIDGGNAVITGKFTAEDAKWLADIIAAGKLPFKLTDSETRYIGPTLGDKALETSVTAGIIGLILVVIFMICVYRIPGIVSVVSLFFYTSLVCAIIVIWKVNLSLPGIAGIILTIGMAVDSNVVIYERIREEIELGKSIRAAVKAGFDRAFTAVFDSNITTIIAAVVLIKFGTGSVKGFGITLLIGVVVALFTAVAVTKVLLNTFDAFGIKNTWLYGAKKRKTENENA